MRVLGISSWEGGAEHSRLLAIIALPCILAVTAVKAEDLEHCYEAAGRMLVGDHELAINYYSHCINRGDLTVENLAISHNNRGLAHYHEGIYERAIQDYDEAIRLDPAYAIAYNNRCWIYGLMHRPNDALRDCNQSLRLSPDDPATLDSRALAYWLLGEHDTARQDLERAREIDPLYPNWQERFHEFEAMF